MYHVTYPGACVAKSPVSWRPGIQPTKLIAKLQSATRRASNIFSFVLFFLLKSKLRTIYAERDSIYFWQCNIHLFYLFIWFQTIKICIEICFWRYVRYNQTIYNHAYLKYTYLTIYMKFSNNTVNWFRVIQNRVIWFRIICMWWLPSVYWKSLNKFHSDPADNLNSKKFIVSRNK